jgi:hypothetical protein
LDFTFKWPSKIPLWCFGYIVWTKSVYIYICIYIRMFKMISKLRSQTHDLSVLSHALK